MSTPCTMTYNHVYSVAFSLNSHREDGHVSGQQLRRAIRYRLANISDEELVEACGEPIETSPNDPLTPTCAERAGWAQSAVSAYAQAKESGAYDPLADMASDLMADLCHLLVREGVLPDLVLERAKTHCQEECAEEGIVI